jgi:hypothetical protein
MMCQIAFLLFSSIQAGLLMTLFAIITSFIAMNLVIAVLCDSLIQLHDSNDISESTLPPAAVASFSETSAKGKEMESDETESLKRQMNLQVDADRLLVQVEKLRVIQMESMETLQQLVDKMHSEIPKPNPNGRTMFFT